MGAAILKPQNAPLTFPKLMEETQIFALWTITDVKELFKRLRSQVNGYSLVEAQFESIILFKEGLAKSINMETLFEILDNDHDGRIDGLELLGGLALCCQASFEDKARFCFELYDFNLTSTISKREMVMMMMASICGMNLLTGGGEELEPDVDTIERLSDEAFLRADREKNGQISYEEFVAWARSNRDLMAAMESLNKVALDAKLDVESDDSAPETDDGDLSDTEPAVEHGTVDLKAQFHRDQLGISSNSIAAAIAAKLLQSKSPLFGKVAGAVSTAVCSYTAVSSIQWKSQIFEPINFKASRQDKYGPDTNLQLCWAFGFRTRGGSRNNLCYVEAETDPDTQRVAYPTAALGVVYDTKTKEQWFYQGHSEEVTCLALHPKGLIIATGDVASNIHIWSVTTMSCQCIIKGISSHGIQHLAFSPSGDRIASVGFDPDHTIAIYDCTTGEIISSAKSLVSPNNVNGIAYSTNGAEVVVVGKNEIKYFRGANTSKRALDTYSGKIGKIGRKQNFFCVTYFNDDVIVGCASGELYRFKAGQCVQIVQAHGIKEPILSINFNPREGVLITGGKDSLVKTWDTTLKEVGASLDLSEDLDGDGVSDCGSLDSAVISVHMLHNRVLVGTRGGDMFEAHLPVSGRVNDPHSLDRIGWGHRAGQFWGLAVHPLRDEFATCGSDKTLRIWSIRSKEQCNVRALPETAQALAYSPQGEIIAIGMIDGSIGLVEADSAGLKAYSTWKNCSEAIADLKFSPDGLYLAAGCKDGNIYLYIRNDDKKTFRRQAVCRGHMGAVTHLDFSANSLYLQSNGVDHALLFWDVRGNQVKLASSLRDTTWATFTCVLGWPVQGVFQEGESFNKVNSCCAIPAVGDTITGNTDHCVKLYRYPAIHTGSLHQSYRGHASGVSCVRFSYNRRHAISLGESDCTILLWAHTMEQAESSGDDEVGTTSQSTGGLGEFIDSRKEIGDMGPRSLLQEAVNSNQPVEVIAQIARLEGPQRDGPRTVQPWKSGILEPSTWVNEMGGTDVDLELQWIHGYRSHDCRNNVRYSAAGSVVYTAATVGVVYSRSAGKQKFFLGAHADDITGIAAHPSGQLFATGETGRQPSVIVWSSQDMRSMARIECSHLTGVPLLAFNSKGDLLASIGLDDNHTLVVHDWAKNVSVLRTHTDKREVFCMCYLADSASDFQLQTSSTDHDASSTNVIVTGGYKHVKFWWSKGQNISSQQGIFGKEVRDVIMCVASGTPGVCVTGSANGTLLLWQDFKAISNVGGHFGEMPFEVGRYPHTSPIQAIWAIPGTVDTLYEGCEEDELHVGLSSSARYLTGDKEGLVATWRLVYNKHSELRLKLVSLLDVSTLEPAPVSPSVRSVCERNGTILLGTGGSEIYEVLDDSISPLTDAFRALKEKRNESNIALQASNITAGVAYTGSSTGSTVPPAYTANLSISEAFARSESSQTAHTAHTITASSSQSHSNLNLTTIERGDRRGGGRGDERSVRVPSLRLISGHHRGELWGLAAHPSLPIYMTCGDDGMIRCWSLLQHKLLSYLKLPEQLRAIDIHPVDGSELAVSLNSGAVWVINAKLLLNPRNIPLIEADTALSGLEVFFSKDALERANRGVGTALPTTQAVSTPASERKAPLDVRVQRVDLRILASTATTWAKEVKYCFDGSTLAVGSHGRKIYLYDVNNSYAPRETVSTPIALGSQEGQVNNSTFITHIDFGVMLPSTPGTDVTYDENSRKIVTSQWQAVTEMDSGTRTLGSMGSRVDSEAKLKMTSSSSRLLDTQGQGQSQGQGQGQAKKKAGRHVVLSTRDLTAKDICIQSVCGTGELLYWNLDGTRIQSVETVKDAYWSSWSLPIGWPVQGIWPPGVDGTEYSINAVARSHSWTSVPVLATADEYGRVKIFNYPCVAPGAPDKSYKGHSAHVTNIKFSADDSYCITTGGSDRCVFVWGTDIIEEKRERDALLTGANTVSIANVQDTDSYLPFKQVVTRGGDESTAIKPWMGSIRAPSTFTEPTGLGDAPNASLELKFVYGYRGWDCRNNVSYADSTQEIVYHVAGVGIVFNCEKQTQIFNTEHDDDILCLAVHPEGHTVATGETGMHPKIVLWDANTGVTLSVIRYHKRGVSHLMFSSSGTLLVSIGMDDDRSIAVHNSKTSALVGTGKAGRGVDVYTISVGGDEKFVTGGKNHIKFWDLPSATSAGGELSSKGGIYGKNIKARSVISSAYIGSDCITGMDDGSIVQWKDRSSTKSVKGHEGPVTAMCSVESSSSGGSVSSGGMIAGMSGGSGESCSPCIISGGKDGFIHVFNAQLVKEWTLDLNLSSPPSALPQIQALSTKEGRILIGTKASEIYEVNRLNTSEIYRYVQGHFGARAEVWGLAVHPTANRFVTSGDDETVRLWDSKGQQQIGITTIGAKVRAVAYDVDGSHVAAATFDGRVVILSADLQSKISEVSVAKSWIQALSYSPDGSTLAVGSHDDNIYLLSTKTYNCRAVLKGHHSYITALDFSIDGKRLQSCSGDYELLFWDTETGKQILSATDMRDVEWSTITCTLGWGVQGIWPPGADGTDVNAVDRSPDGTLLATGDDFKRVKIFKNPCPKDKSKFKEYKGHSEFVVNVKFSKDGKWLYTVGGLDKAVCQFEIKAVSNTGNNDIAAPVVPVKNSPVVSANNNRNRKK